MRILVVLVVLASFPALSEPSDTAEFGTVEIAPPEVALTFARIQRGGVPRLIAVTAYESGRVSGVDLTAALGSDAKDPIDVYATHGYDVLQVVAGGTPDLEVPVKELVMPVGLGASHIAAGTNFPEHAEEATVEDGPFLFPKQVAPTAFDAPISAGDALLDYEVELCFVGLEAIDPTRPPARTGLLLCNDVTNRATLLRHIDPFDVASGNGFTAGKSAPGFLPIGSLFVIPREMRSFADAVQLELYVNGEPRQAAIQSQAVWDFDELLRQIQARETVRWSYQGEPVGLALVEGRIPVRTAILGGTPSGTVFQGVATSTFVRGGFDWLLGGWGESVVHWVVERHIAEASASGRYLQPGDRVQIRVDRLGELDNMVVE